MRHNASYEIATSGPGFPGKAIAVCKWLDPRFCELASSFGGVLVAGACVSGHGACRFAHAWVPGTLFIPVGDVPGPVRLAGPAAVGRAVTERSSIQVRPADERYLHRAPGERQLVGLLLSAQELGDKPGSGRENEFRHARRRASAHDETVAFLLRS